MKLKTELDRTEAYKRSIEKVIYHEIEDTFKCGQQHFSEIYEVSRTDEELAYAAMLYHHLDEEYNANNEQLIYNFKWEHYESSNY